MAYNYIYRQKRSTINHSNNRPTIFNAGEELTISPLTCPEIAFFFLLTYAKIKHFYLAEIHFFFLSQQKKKKERLKRTAEKNRFFETCEPAK